MKPIKLTLAGLHSYREQQEIDFEKLTDLGVFGIFGPTGSGKSTILDAMTVAKARPSRPLRFSHKGSGESAFLISIDESANEGGGRTSKNWFYRVNDQLGDESFGLKELNAGDKVLWHFGKYVPK